MTIQTLNRQSQFDEDFKFWEEVDFEYSNQIRLTDSSGRFVLRSIINMPFSSHNIDSLKKRVTEFVRGIDEEPYNLQQDQRLRLKRVLRNINILKDEIFDRKLLDGKPRLKAFFYTAVGEQELAEDLKFLLDNTIRGSGHLGIDNQNGKLLLRWMTFKGYTTHEKLALQRRLLNVVNSLPGKLDELQLRSLLNNLLNVHEDIFKPEWIAQNEGLIHFLSPKVKASHDYKEVVRQACASLLMGKLPEETDGCSGCIILKNPEGEKVAVFKPLSQENMSESNRRYAQQIKRLGAGVAKGLGKGSILDTTGGQAYLAEVTAYEISCLIRQGLVAETHKVELVINNEVEVGAFQLFVKGKVIDIKQLFRFGDQRFEKGSDTFDEIDMLHMIPREYFEDFVLIKWVMGDCDTHGENGLVVLEETPTGRYSFRDDDVLTYKDSQGKLRELGDHPQLRGLFPGTETFDVKNLVAIDASWGNAPKHPELQAEQEKFLLAAAKLPHGEFPFMERIGRIKGLLSKLDELDLSMRRFYAKNGQDTGLTEERIQRRRERMKVLDIFVRTNRPIKELFSMNSESVIEKLIVEDACNELKTDEVEVREKFYEALTVEADSLVGGELQDVFRAISCHFACMNQHSQLTDQDKKDIAAFEKKLNEWKSCEALTGELHFHLLQSLL